MGKQKFQNPISLRLTNVLTFGNLSKLDNLKDNELTIRNICHLEWEYKMISKYGEIFRIFITKNDENAPTLLLIIPAPHGVDFENFIEDCKTGSTIAHLNQKAFYEYLFPTPAKELQNKFVVIAEQADKSEFELRKSIDLTDRKSLIKG